MDAAGKATTMGRLSRAVAGHLTFDVETEARLEDRPQVRTYVYRNGRLVDRVVWSLEAHDQSAGRKMVNLQHEVVLQKIAQKGKTMASSSSEEEFEAGLVASIMPPASTSEPRPLVAAAPVVSSANVSSANVSNANDASAPLAPATASSSVARLLAPSKVPSAEDVLRDALMATGVVERGIVIDADGMPVCEIGDDLERFAQLAFLGSGLESLLTRHLDLGSCEGVFLEGVGGTVLVARSPNLTLAFAAPRRVSSGRAIQEVRRVLVAHEEVTA
jgi:hypothetical protein